MYKFLAKLLTKKSKRIPILFISFNLDHYLKNGSNNSFTIKIHPNFRDNEEIKEHVNLLVDYIKNTYNIKDIL